ncbi:GNAT family N-acetyltransferase [Verrucomicrobiota bacterium]
MTTDKESLCVTMVNDDLSAGPTYEMSPDYHIRWYVQGDQETWTAIQGAADRDNAITQDLFRREFPEGTFDLGERQCYLCDRAARALGTATAWAETKGQYTGYGLVHWVAVLPEFQRHGIGSMLMSVVCRRLVDLGHERACLRTSTLRPGAIALYRRFGFVTASVDSWT